jgi:hypothetical protein
MAYQGKYQVKNIAKYEGDASKVVYRSLWEAKLMQWCDLNPDVIKFSSEEVIIPYRCKTDGEMHRYFVDFKITFKNGKVLLVEVKPDCQTKPPKRPQRMSAGYITETATYVKNISKWEAAVEYANSRGWEFRIFTENTLEKMGIKIMNRRR